MCSYLVNKNFFVLFVRYNAINNRVVKKVYEMLLGKRLRELRKTKGYSQTQLGKLINVTKVSISGYETENRTPNLETLIDLAEVLETSLDYLIGHDVQLILEQESTYVLKVSREELDFIRELKRNKALYKRMTDDPKRLLELMDKKLK